METGQEIPQSWVGRTIEANIINPAEHDGFGTSSSLTGMYCTGTLEAVNSLGIVASFQYTADGEEKPPPPSTFYPWSSVLWLRPIEP